jgi:hypothetical protein
MWSGGEYTGTVGDGTIAILLRIGFKARKKKKKRHINN